MKLITSTLLLGTALADMYLQFPGGSNNRLDEEGRAVQNDKRLFDSQNNNRFGYNQASHAFYHNSEINFKWTVQHGCGAGSNVNCQIILQYSCGDDLRDGESISTIPTNQNECKDNNCNTDWKYGMHENFQNYQHCNLRERNYRLFNADQHLRDRNTARFTRQDNNGQRFGYQCNEERDYYPYWQPTIWRDIAVLTDEPERDCPYYEAESENVKGRAYCYVPDEILDYFYEDGNTTPRFGINATSCEGFKQRLLSGEEDVGNDNDFSSKISTDIINKIEWTETDSFGLPAPDCRANTEHRDNHHGNIHDSHHFDTYTWKVPENIVSEQCVFRIRYNMTSSDYDWRNTDVENHIRDDPGCMCRNNYGADMWSHLGWDGAKAKARGFRHRNDATIKIFPGIDLGLAMAYNTDQLGRTFEDRTHIIKIRPLPSQVAEDLTLADQADERIPRIINLNVMGKIGNYVEVYPNAEYDFVPSIIDAKVGDYLHIQWAGSNTNNWNNDGSQTRPENPSETIDISRKKDRHNIIRIANMTSIYPMEDKSGNGKISPIFGLPVGDAIKLATDGLNGGDNRYLENSAPSYDFGLVQLKEEGVFSFMSSHNNKFGVRTHKGQLRVRAEN